MSSYKILGVRRTATEEEIRTAYKLQVLLVHPDKGGSAAAFKQLQEAYDTLKDPEKRDEYEARLQTATLKRKESNAASWNKPIPLSFVKCPVRFLLPDGTTYDFETSVDRLKSRFKHGDIVENCKGEQGSVIGLASNGVYWNRNGTATLLFTDGFGGDRDIKLLYRHGKSGIGGSSTTPRDSTTLRAATPRRATTASSKRTATTTAATLHTASATTPGKSTPAPRNDILQRAQQRQLVAALKNICQEEEKQRRHVHDTTSRFLKEFHDTMGLFHSSCDKSILRATTPRRAQPIPKLLPARTPRKNNPQEQRDPTNHTTPVRNSVPVGFFAPSLRSVPLKSPYQRVPTQTDGESPIPPHADPNSPLFWKHTSIPVPRFERKTASSSTKVRYSHVPSRVFATFRTNDARCPAVDRSASNSPTSVSPFRNTRIVEKGLGRGW